MILKQPRFSVVVNVPAYPDLMVDVFNFSFEILQGETSFIIRSAAVERLKWPSIGAWSHFTWSNGGINIKLRNIMKRHRFKHMNCCILKILNKRVILHRWRFLYFFNTLCWMCKEFASKLIHVFCFLFFFPYSFFKRQNALWWWLLLQSKLHVLRCTYTKLY